MSSYRIERPAKIGITRFYTGDETGALYVRADGGRYICLVPANGSVKAGDWEVGGGFTPVPTGSTITIEV